MSDGTKNYSKSVITPHLSNAKPTSNRPVSPTTPTLREGQASVQPITNRNGSLKPYYPQIKNK